MEVNSDQAILNNIGGTNNVIDLCDLFSVSQYIVISTDKAVEPSNAMGATKRLCELLTLSKSQSSEQNFAVFVLVTSWDLTAVLSHYLNNIKMVDQLPLRPQYDTLFYDHKRSG